MRRALDIFRMVIISPECAALLFIWALSTYWPSPFVFIGDLIKQDDEVWKFLPVLPLALIPFIVSTGRQLHSPSSANNRLLHQWPDFWRLKWRIVLSMTWGGFAVLCSIVVWLTRKPLPPLGLGVAFILSCAVAVIVAFTLVLAHMTLKELIED